MKRLVTILFTLTCSAPSLLIASERKAPGFDYQSDEGNKSFFSLLKTNKVALIYFGDDSQKSWKILTEVDALLSEHRYRGSNLEVLLFIQGKNVTQLGALEEEHWLNAGLLPDPDEKIAQSFNVRKYPMMVIVDPFGIVQFQGEVPPQDVLREKLNSYVDKPIVKAFCPIDKMWVVITDKTPSVVYKGNHYYFCSSEDHDGRRMDQEFLQDPERYVKETRLHMEKETAIDKSEKTGSPALHECPMKDSPAQNKPGTCPKCGMLLQKIQD